MAIKPPPEPIDHHYNIGKLTKAFALSSIALLAAFVLMVKEDHFRGWKDWQEAFRKQERVRTREALQAAAEKIDPQTEATYLAKKREGARYLRQHRSGLHKAEAKDRAAEGKWYGSDQRFRFLKAEMDTARYQYEVANVEDAKAASTAKKRERYLELKAEFEKSQLAEQAAKKEWDAAKAEVAAFQKLETDAVDALKKLDEDYDRYRAKLKTLRDDSFFFVRNAPFADMLAPSLKIEQVQLDGLFNDMQFLKTQRIDRCMTCHIAADKRGYEDKEKYPVALRTHPRLDLFVDSNSPHPYATFGCTSCHGGLDRATDFMRAGHMPADYQEYEEILQGDDPDAAAETQTGRWMKKYGWRIDRFLETPMYPTKAVEAGCFRCHKSEVNHPKAPTLDKGRKLIENLGCWGCHKMKGFEDLPKVGPALTSIASKTTPEWVSRWLSNPRTFRHNTKMPRFFYLENFTTPEDRAKTDTMVAGIVAYLFEKSERPALAPVETGSAERGQKLFETIGCQGCHISDPKAERDVMSGWRQHGPNLVGLADKTTPQWLAHWLKNPKAWNPVTRMPNLRLSDAEISDLTAFLMTKTSAKEFGAIPVPKADDAQRNDLIKDYLTLSKSVAEADAELARMSPHEKDLFVGERIIAHYGCYACHSIAGFENAKPIGVELSEWGNKAVHLLDFGFLHVPHTRADWLHQKVKAPRSFDRDKVKLFQEKLKMPLFSLSEDEVTAVQSTVLGFQKDDMAETLKARPVGERLSVEHGRRLVKEYNCQGCHILEDKGGQIRETLQDVALAPPNIRGEGAKVQSDWLFAFVKGPKTGQIRPWLNVRMPTFDFTDDQLNALTAFFAGLDKARYPFVAKVDTLEARSREAGARTFEALKCAQCHPTSQNAFQEMLTQGKTPADLAPILSNAHNRLRYEWIADWIKRPDEWMPGTRMPTNFPRVDDKSDKRVSPLAAALDTPAFADFKRQLVSIWGSEEEAKAFIGDPERVTKALRDHVWALGNEAVATIPAHSPARTGGR